MQRCTRTGATWYIQEIIRSNWAKLIDLPLHNVKGVFVASPRICARLCVQFIVALSAWKNFKGVLFYFPPCCSFHCTFKLDYFFFFHRQFEPTGFNILFFVMINEQSSILHDERRQKKLSCKKVFAVFLLLI